MFTTDEIQRYSRHFCLPGFGPEGQARLKAGSVLCIGAGGLGSPALLYLAAAGVGKIGIVDADRVDFSNLQRQVLFGMADVGKLKVEAARDRLRAMNPSISVEVFPERFSSANAASIVEGYKVLLDGSDNFATRYLSNDVAFWRKIPNIYGSVMRYEGQVAVFAPHLGSPCYRCMFPAPPPPGAVPT